MPADIIPLPPEAPQTGAAPAESLDRLRQRPEARQSTPLVTPLEPLLVDTDQASAACGISSASWFRLKAAGKTPAPVRLGGRVLYRVSDLELWVVLGCPTRPQFEALRAAQADKK